MGNRAAEMMISATTDFLCRYPPFDRMEADGLRFVAERLKLAYFPKDAAIVSPDGGVVQTCYIIQRGKVLARQAGDVNVVDYSSMSLGAGEVFPIGSISGQRASTNEYTAIDDVFCYQLAAPDFFELMRMSPAFNLFCTRYIASLLGQSRLQLQSQFAQRAAEQQTLNSPLSSLAKKVAVSVLPDVPIRQVLELMDSRRIGSMVVVDGEMKPVGVFTQSDVIKRIVLPGRSLDGPISDVMSGEPHTLSCSASAYDAMLAMARYGIRHVLAVDDGGRLKAVVSERDLFTLQRVGVRQLRQAIDTAADVKLLRQAAADVRLLAFNMVAQGVGAEQLTQFVSALNDSLTRRIIQLNESRHDLFDITWAWLAFGSEGRDEQTFSTDQDNGIIFACDGTDDREALRGRLLAFARDVNADLDRVGFPHCKGNIMAGNPELCLHIAEWEAKFSAWVESPSPKALLNAAIFFDFRPLCGAIHLADRLRAWMLNVTRRSPIFLRMMAQNALEVAPPLGRLRDFVSDADPENPGCINMKNSGVRLFVDAARIFALAHGIAASNTIQRLKQSAGAMGVAADEVGAIVEGFDFIQLLRLRHQHFESGQGRRAGNLIRPEQLNELERRILKESFRQARKLQQRLKLDYQL